MHGSDPFTTVNIDRASIPRINEEAVAACEHILGNSTNIRLQLTRQSKYKRVLY